MTNNMGIYKIVNSAITQFVLNSKIDISGEINVLEPDHTKAIMLNETLFDKVLTGVELLRVQYPYLEISASRELHEISIKFFGYRKSFIYTEDFFEILQLYVRELVDPLVEEASQKIRINLFGQVNTWERSEKFIIINNNRDIYFKITEKKQNGKVLVILGDLIKNYLLRKIF